MIDRIFSGRYFERQVTIFPGVQVGKGLEKNKTREKKKDHR